MNYKIDVPSGEYRVHAPHLGTPETMNTPMPCQRCKRLVKIAENWSIKASTWAWISLWLGLALAGSLVAHACR